MRALLARVGGLVLLGVVVLCAAHAPAADVLTIHAKVFGPAAEIISADEVRAMWHEHLAAQRHSLQGVVNATWNLFLAFMRAPHDPQNWLTALPHLCTPNTTQEYLVPGQRRVLRGVCDPVDHALVVGSVRIPLPVQLPGGNMGFFTNERVDVYDALAVHFELAGFRVAHGAYASHAVSASLGVHTRCLVVAMI